MNKIRYEEMSLNEAYNTLDYAERPEDIDRILKVFSKGDTEWELTGYLIIYSDGMISQLNEEQCCNVADIDYKQLRNIIDGE